MQRQLTAAIGCASGCATFGAVSCACHDKEDAKLSQKYDTMFNGDQGQNEERFQSISRARSII